MIGTTAAALSWCVSPWLAPPYLLAMGWLLLVPSRRDDDRANGGCAIAGASDPGSEAGGLAPLPDELEDSDAAAGATTSPPASGLETDPTRPRKGKGRGRGKAKLATDRPAATWIQVAPGKFVRVEAPAADGVPEPHGDGSREVAPSSVEPTSAVEGASPEPSIEAGEARISAEDAPLGPPVDDDPASERATLLAVLPGPNSPALLEVLRTRSSGPWSDAPFGGPPLSIPLDADLDHDGQGSCIAQVALTVEAPGGCEPGSHADVPWATVAIEDQRADGLPSSHPEERTGAEPVAGVAETPSGPVAGPGEDGFSEGPPEGEAAPETIDDDRASDQSAFSELLTASPSPPPDPERTAPPAGTDRGPSPPVPPGAARPPISRRPRLGGASPPPPAAVAPRDRPRRRGRPDRSPPSTSGNAPTLAVWRKIDRGRSIKLERPRFF